LGSHAEEQFAAALQALVQRGALKRVERKVPFDISGGGRIVADFATTAPNGSPVLIQIKRPRLSERDLYERLNEEVLFLDPSETAGELQAFLREMDQGPPAMLDGLKLLRASARSVSNVFTPAGAGPLIREGFWRGVGNAIVLLIVAAIGIVVGYFLRGGP
jgi:hypothetical protein